MLPPVLDYQKRDLQMRLFVCLDAAKKMPDKNILILLGIEKCALNPVGQFALHAAL
jgi:hypothetical protein